MLHHAADVPGDGVRVELLPDHAGPAVRMEQHADGAFVLSRHLLPGDLGGVGRPDAAEVGAARAGPDGQPAVLRRVRDRVAGPPARQRHPVLPGLRRGGRRRHWPGVCDARGDRRQVVPRHAGPGHGNRGDGVRGGRARAEQGARAVPRGAGRRRPSGGVPVAGRGVRLHPDSVQPYAEQPGRGGGRGGRGRGERRGRESGGDRRKWNPRVPTCSPAGSR